MDEKLKAIVTDTTDICTNNKRMVYILSDFIDKL